MLWNFSANTQSIGFKTLVPAWLSFEYFYLRPRDFLTFNDIESMSRKESVCDCVFDMGKKIVKAIFVH